MHACVHVCVPACVSPPSTWHETLRLYLRTSSVHHQGEPRGLLKPVGGNTGASPPASGPPPPESELPICLSSTLPHGEKAPYLGEPQCMGVSSAFQTHRHTGTSVHNVPETSHRQRRPPGRPRSKCAHCDSRACPCLRRTAGFEDLMALRPPCVTVITSGV